MTDRQFYWIIRGAGVYFLIRVIMLWLKGL